MRATKIEQLLNALGTSRVSSTGSKVRSTCPLAPWRHSSGKDSHPSFVVFVADNDESRCKCLGAACNFKGSLIQLVWAYGKHSKTDVSRYINFVHQNDQADVGGMLDRIKSNLGMFAPRDPATITPWTLGPDAGDPFVLADAAGDLKAHEAVVEKMEAALGEEALEYLKGPERRLDDAAIKRWRLGWHPTARRVAVPQFDRNGRLVNIGGRHLASPFDNPFWTPPKWMHAADFKKELFLFGEDRLTSYDGKITGFLVEGMFDAIGLDMRGIPNVVAMLGAYVSPMQYKKLVSWFNRLVIIPDGDKEGYKAADRIVDMIGKKIRTDMFNTPMGFDPDELTDESLDKIRREYLT